AYTGAFVRGGFEAVDKGQMEAARSLGFTYNRSMRKVIMPQGLKIMVPSFINQFIITLKDTSILSAIGLITLILNEGAYTGAFVRGGFEAVDKGQMEAARSLGFTYNRSMRKVIMPQGLKIMVPSFINQFIITLKDTSILSAIGILELTQIGTLIVSRNSQGFRVWAIVAVIYLVVITLLTWLSNWVEKRTRA
ncbi:hypothetical protein BMS67_00170, partial [Leuconostoc mesenteroides subsp. cremoris]|uniref:amino acid ABC transporter permease n=1 Tax=Leuconostoc mesenteroides TaxID=1245 RepID=UPI000A0C8E05